MDACIIFSECEHNSDLDNYLDDLRSSGARVLRHRINHDTEEGEVYVSLEEPEKFYKKFKETESYEFSNVM